MMQKGKQKQNTKASKHTRTVRTSSILQLDVFVQVKNKSKVSSSQKPVIWLFLFNCFHSSLQYTVLIEEVESGASPF